MNSLSLTAGIVGALLSISTASATTIATGQANFNGTVTVNSGGVFFADNGMTPNFFNVSNPNTGGFAGLTGGTIQNLTGAALTGTVSVPAFVTFTVPGGPVIFDLTSIAPGLGTNAACGSNTVGNVCTPTGSPFTLIQRTAGQVEIDLSVGGIAYTGSSATGSDVSTGLFTTQNLVPGTITDILSAVTSPGGITNSYSATFSATAPSPVIPEPGTYVLLGLGLISVASVRKRTRKE